MQTLGTRAVARSGGLLAVLAACSAGLGRALPGSLRAIAVGAHDPARVDAVLVLGALVALLLVTGWATVLALTALLQALGSARAARTLERCCPAPWRRTLLAACGLAVVAAVPARAADHGGTPAPPAADRVSAPLAGLPSLDRPVGVVAAPARPGLVIRVRPGDSLWRIVAERHPAAPDRRVARLVDALYRANRAVIGSDPDLIRPGQLLRPADRPTQLTRRTPR
jgi:Tfp pilus assembly protein FimV